MHDFRKLVDPAESETRVKAKLCSELACHLEEMYMDLRGGGASEEHALAAVSAAGKDLGSVAGLRWQREGGIENLAAGNGTARDSSCLSSTRVCNLGLGVSLGISRPWRKRVCFWSVSRLGFWLRHFAGMGGRAAASAMGRVYCDLVPGCCGVRHDFSCNSPGIG